MCLAPALILMSCFIRRTNIFKSLALHLWKQAKPDDSCDDSLWSTNSGGCYKLCPLQLPNSFALLPEQWKTTFMYTMRIVLHVYNEDSIACGQCEQYCMYTIKWTQGEGFGEHPISSAHPQGCSSVELGREHTWSYAAACSCQVSAGVCWKSGGHRGSNPNKQQWRFWIEHAITLPKNINSSLSSPRFLLWR